MEYTIIIYKNPNGWYTGQCEQVPEAISQGETLEELKENMADAIKMVIDYKKEETRKLYAGKKIFRRRVAVL
ncbi:MAG: type II toxin-antitoxin system HicB family antitoxin [Bacteroidales bacterium]|nr:type II toxin-antitoxin system HicB family antitoxin [Bacteroidales bacterium]MBR3827712.1 type II toxin-antitoxin system HicB family antitoxin [Bacteroidales bacterium]MBR6330843.1 type II toxin-antitoxin system HicB family antitoxin [Bacteroidales bacterium]